MKQLTYNNLKNTTKIYPFNIDWLIQERKLLMSLPINENVILMLRLNARRFGSIEYGKP